jgi:hypothetical protein
VASTKKFKFASLASGAAWCAGRQKSLGARPGVNNRAVERQLEKDKGPAISYGSPQINVIGATYLIAKNQFTPVRATEQGSPAPLRSSIMTWSKVQWMILSGRTWRLNSKPNAAVFLPAFFRLVLANKKFFAVADR